jgi:hypothetical protein
MAHYHFINDTSGDLIDSVTFCSDWCHNSWCQRTGNQYGGWNGCHELEFSTPCVNCGGMVEGIQP